jgi:hypothetical protein
MFGYRLFVQGKCKMAREMGEKREEEREEEREMERENFHGFGLRI